MRTVLVTAMVVSLALAIMPASAWARPRIGGIVALDVIFKGVPKTTTARDQTVCMTNVSDKELHEIVFAKLLTSEAQAWSIEDASDALYQYHGQSPQPGLPEPIDESLKDRSLGGNVTRPPSPFHEVEAAPGESSCATIKFTGPGREPDTTLGPGRYLYFCPIVGFSADDPTKNGLPHWDPSSPRGGQIGFIDVK